MRPTTELQARGGRWEAARRRTTRGEAVQGHIPRKDRTRDNRKHQLKAAMSRGRRGGGSSMRQNAARSTCLEKENKGIPGDAE